MQLYETIENLNNVREKYFEAFEKLKDQEKIFITNGDSSGRRNFKRYLEGSFDGLS